MMHDLASTFSLDALPEIGAWRYLLLALLVAVEGPAATLVAGAMAGTGGGMNPLLVFLFAGLGNMTADAGWYALGYLGHFQRLQQRLPWLAQYAPAVQRLRVQMRRHAVKLLLITKLSLGIAIIPTLIAAGIVRVSWRRLLPVSLLSETIWTGGLVLLGYFFGGYLAQLQWGLQVAGVTTAVLLLLGSLWLLKRYLQTRVP